MVENVKNIGILWVEELLKNNLTYTKPGTITYLLYGEKPSEQSINIKFGHFGEIIAKELIKLNNNFELLTCGVQIINDKKKDIDLIFKDDINKIIYYRELDSEKLPATISKCKEIEKYLQIKYNNYIIDSGILNWSVYNRQILKTGLPNIKIFENKEIKINHMKDFLDIIKIEWTEDDYYSYFRKLGLIIKNS
jgi:hypothetical protein